MRLKLAGIGIAVAVITVVFVARCRPMGAETTLRETVADTNEFSQSQVAVEIDRSTSGVAGLLRGTFVDATGVLGVGDVLDVKWDVRSADFDEPVRCSSLRQTAKPTVSDVRRVENASHVTFSIPITDNRLFDSPLQGDPDFFRKVTVESLKAYRGPVRGEVCLKAQGIEIAGAQDASKKAHAAGFALADDTYENIVEYGQECAEQAGYIAPFSCLEDSVVLPVTQTVNGQTTEATTAVPDCDRPAHLGLGDEGQCVPYSRLGYAKVYKDAAYTTPMENAFAVFICRRYKSRPIDDPRFEDVAIVHHNKATGATCFYQQLYWDDDNDGGRENPRDTRRVPPPHEVELPADAPSYARAAAKFWLSPVETNGFACVMCHDSDPIMVTPYVLQAKDAAGRSILPAVRKGKYDNIGAKYPQKAWVKPKALSVKGDAACTSCHRLGTAKTCRSWIANSTAGKITTGSNLWARTFPQSHWMPEEHGEEALADWDATYGESLAQLKSCCQQLRFRANEGEIPFKIDYDLLDPDVCQVKEIASQHP